MQGLSPKQLRTLGCSILAIGVLLGNSPAAFAQLRTEVLTEKGATFTLKGQNQSRPEEGIMLYTPDFGETTRTNRYGVEITAVPASNAPNVNPSQQWYTVTGSTNVWLCDKNSALFRCGNAEIPDRGVVLSAMGSIRKPLLESFPVGTKFSIKSQWFQSTQYDVSVLNPSPENNPFGSAFPGYRAGQQLVVYDARTIRPTTGTNEFGFEVTVTDGRITAIEGSDSTIPPDAATGFVLSGHGKARDWLIASCPLGAKATLSYKVLDFKTVPGVDPYADAHSVQSVQCEIDYETYARQLEGRIAENAGRIPPAVQGVLNKDLARIKRQVDTEKLEAAARISSETLEYLNHELWKTSPSFPPSSIHASWTRPTEKSAGEVGQTLDLLKKAGINTVFLETFFHGYPIFPSKTFEGYGLANNQYPKFKGIDLLQTYLEEAHKRGMQVHVWFQDFYVGTRALEAPGPILSKYPQWANVQYSAIGNVGPTPSTLETGGYFMDPANPEARQFLLRLIEEVVTRYPVDGFQFDYIRYPASFPPDRFSYLKTTWGYTPSAREAFRAQTGIDPIDLNPVSPEWEAWNQYKTDQVTRFIEEGSRMIRRVNPKVIISADIFPRHQDAVTQKHQDWPTWVDRGYLDFVAPMTLTSSVKVVDTDMRAVVDRINQSGKPVPVVAGVFSPFNNNTAEVLLAQIAAAKASGSSGFALFDTAHLTGRMIQALGASAQVKISTKGKP